MAVAKIKENKRSVILAVLLCALVCYFVATLISIQAKVRAQQNINETLSATYQQKLEENAELEERISNGGDEENMDRIAREEYGYAMPDERVYYDSAE
ncbi:MAG: septum formation initiator family protein [Clostridia bacterium]|nr:septum formation initiator family protein [Clostridia bacterium]